MSIEYSCVRAARSIAEGVLKQLYNGNVGCTVNDIDPFHNTCWTYTDFVRNGTSLKIDGVPLRLTIQAAVTGTFEVRVHMSANRQFTYQVYGSDLWKDGNDAFVHDAVGNVMSLFRRFHGFTDLPVVSANDARRLPQAMFIRPSITVVPLRADAAAPASAAAVLRGDGAAAVGNALGGSAPPEHHVNSTCAAFKRLRSKYEERKKAAKGANPVPMKPMGKANAAKKAAHARRAAEKAAHARRVVGKAEGGAGWLELQSSSDESSSDESSSSGSRKRYRVANSDSDPSSPR